MFVDVFILFIDSNILFVCKYVNSHNALLRLPGIILYMDAYCILADIFFDLNLEFEPHCRNQDYRFWPYSTYVNFVRLSSIVNYFGENVKLPYCNNCILANSTLHI
jgi:hypothetical protein